MMVGEGNFGAGSRGNLGNYVPGYIGGRWPPSVRRLIYFRRDKNLSIASWFSLIFSSCSCVELKIDWRVGKLSRSCWAAAGPIPGKPSRMNCFCSSFVLRVLVWRIAFCGFGFSYRLASRIRKFAVSSSFSVYIIGIWKSVAIERSIPLIAFSWMLNLS